jgi:hypothetical protein
MGLKYGSEPDMCGSPKGGKMDKKKYGYYKRDKGIVQRPELIREFEAQGMRHDKDYVTFINWQGTTQQQVGAIHLDKGEWVEEIKN